MKFACRLPLMVLVVSAACAVSVMPRTDAQNSSAKANLVVDATSAVFLNATQTQTGFGAANSSAKAKLVVNTTSVASFNATHRQTGFGTLNSTAKAKLVINTTSVASLNATRTQTGLGTFGRVAFRGLLQDGTNTSALFALRARHHALRKRNVSTEDANETVEPAPSEEFLQSCSRHLRRLIEELDQHYTDMQLESALTNECELSSSFPLVSESGFDDKHICAKLAKELAEIRLRTLENPDSLETLGQYRAFCESYYERGIDMTATTAMPSNSNRVCWLSRVVLLVSAAAVHSIHRMVPW